MRALLVTLAARRQERLATLAALDTQQAMRRIVRRQLVVMPVLAALVAALWLVIALNGGAQAHPYCGHGGSAPGSFDMPNPGGVAHCKLVA